MMSNEQFLMQMNAQIKEETGMEGLYSRFCMRLPIEVVYTPESVYMAACHCASGFRDRPDTCAFMDHAWSNSVKLTERVVNGEFKPSYYKTKEILERGKPRIIRPPKFECKVVQKVLCDLILRAMLEPLMTETNFGSVRGRGTDSMHEQILFTLNSMKPGNVIVMTDLSGYFASIDTELMCEDFRRMGMDGRLLALFHSFDPEGIGLSLGNEASQIPASWFPSTTDHALVNAGFTPYRFMDDTLIPAESDKRADECIRITKEECRKRHLILKEEKLQKITWGKDFIFCKERYFFDREKKCYYRIQNPSAARNEIRKLNRFEVKIKSGEMRVEDALLQGRSVLGSMEKHPNNRKQVERVSRKLFEATGHYYKEKKKKDAKDSMAELTAQEVDVMIKDYYENNLLQKNYGE